MFYFFSWKQFRHNECEDVLHMLRYLPSHSFHKFGSYLLSHVHFCDCSVRTTFVGSRKESSSTCHTLEEKPSSPIFHRELTPPHCPSFFSFFPFPLFFGKDRVLCMKSTLVSLFQGQPHWFSCAVGLCHRWPYTTILRYQIHGLSLSSQAPFSLLFTSAERRCASKIISTPDHVFEVRDTWARRSAKGISVSEHVALNLRG